MLKKLQIKFIALVMGVVVLILAAVFIGIGAMTYQQTWDRLASDLSTSIDASANEREPEVRQGAFGPNGEGFRGSQMPPDLGRHPNERVETPVAVYTLTNGIFALASRSGAIMDDDLLSTMAPECVAAPSDRLTPSQHGMVFLKRQMNGTTYVAFANDSAADGLRRLIAAFAVAGIAAVVAFFAISILFSRWALKPVRRAWDQQREFVSNASHELKTPLAIIKANTEILRDEPDANEADRAKWLASTQESTEAMEDLVNDMLALASMDEMAERTSVKAAPAESVDLSRLAEGQVLQFESRAFEGGFQLESDIPEGITVRTSADAVARLMQILLDNACKYVNPGGTVLMTLAQDGAHVMVTVSNTGDPIPPEKLERIFDRFYRADEARDTQSGHGLGLAIAKALADQLCATLSATSTSEATSFTLTL